MLKITKVHRGSIAKELGLEVGDKITKFDGYPAVDELDYIYYCTLSHFLLTVEDKNGSGEQTVEVEKEEDESLGIEFEKNTSIKTCHNHCLFCFVDQMPKGMRESLYIKDDDYGMSFTCGNFVTLTNLPDEELDRIIRLRLSPLYVSVHTMNGELRKKLLCNRFADKIIQQIDKLCKNKIRMHCQSVIVPNENDGEEFAYTARELFKYYPYVMDVAAVPTGITKYREGLYPIPDVDGEYSKKFLDLVDSLNAEFGVNFIFPADEYFVKSGRAFKDADFYGDFEQIENGIGMTSKFIMETENALSELKENIKLKKKKKVLLISGVSAVGINKIVLDESMKKIENLDAEVLPVVNNFFGETVTCTGLLTGVDILSALNNYKVKNGDFDEVILPSNTLKEFEDVFLCGMSLEELKKQLKFKNIQINREGGYGLVTLLSENK